MRSSRLTNLVEFPDHVDWWRSDSHRYSECDKKLQIEAGHFVNCTSGSRIQEVDFVLTTEQYSMEREQEADSHISGIASIMKTSKEDKTPLYVEWNDMKRWQHGKVHGEWLWAVSGLYTIVHCQVDAWWGWVGDSGRVSLANFAELFVVLNSQKISGAKKGTCYSRSHFVKCIEFLLLLDCYLAYHRMVLSALLQHIFLSQSLAGSQGWHGSWRHSYSIPHDLLGWAWVEVVS